jgi:hypothetical protein
MMRKSCVSDYVLCLSLALVMPAFGQEFQEIRVNVEPAKFSIEALNGQGFKVGGFSGMAPAFNLGANRFFYIISDRGPNLDIFEYIRINEDGKSVYLDASGNETTDIALAPAGAKGFAAPYFGPAILLVQVPPTGLARIVRVTSLTKLNGERVSGLPNHYVDPSATPPVTEEGPVEDILGNSLGLDPDGIDSEGIAVDPFGLFWISDEYPSVCAVAPGGKVILRLVPEGRGPGKDILTFDRLPGLLTKRVPNRGLEGITLLSPGIVLTSLQRPLANPDKATSEASSNIRLLRINMAKLLCGKPGAIQQLIYVTDGKANKGTYISDLFSLSAGTVLASERRTNKVFRVALAGATDVSSLETEDGILLTPVEYDYTVQVVDADGGVTPKTMHVKRTTIEQLLVKGPDGITNELALAGIIPVSKTSVLDLASIVALDANNGKFEGLCVSGGDIFLCPDNDFDILNAIRLKAEQGAPPNVPELQLFDPPNYSRIFRIRGVDLTRP